MQTLFNWEIAYEWNMRFIVVMALRYSVKPFLIEKHEPIRAYWKLLHGDDPVEMEVALTPEGIAKLDGLFDVWLAEWPTRQRWVAANCVENLTEEVR
jgi:hypothetical protein